MQLDEGEFGNPAYCYEQVELVLRRHHHLLAASMSAEVTVLSQHKNKEADQFTTPSR